MSPLRCLVVHPGALGDVLLARPALARLRELGYSLTLAATPRLGALLVAGGAVEAAIDFEALGLHRLFVGTGEPEAASRLRAFDLVVSWFGSGDAGYREALGAIARRAVVARATPQARTHVSAYLLATLRVVGSPAGAPATGRLGVPPAGRASAHRWLAEVGLGAGDAVVVQAGAGSPAKVFPGAAALVGRLAAAGYRVVVTAGPADGAALAALLAHGAVPATRVARNWPVDRLAGLFALARAFVGHDSGPTHLAAAIGCPTLALFGPSDPVLWRPVGERARVLAGAGPGATAPWDGLSVDDVAAALSELVTGQAESGGEPATGAAALAAGR